MLEYRLKRARNEGKVEDLGVEGGGRKFQVPRKGGREVR